MTDVRILEGDDARQAAIDAICRTGRSMSRIARAAGVTPAIVSKWKLRKTTPTLATWIPVLSAACAKVLVTDGAREIILDGPEKAVDMIASFRARAGITCSKLSKATGVADSTIHNWECKSSFPEVEGAARVFRELGWSMIVRFGPVPSYFPWEVWG